MLLCVYECMWVKATSKPRYSSWDACTRVTLQWCQRSAADEATSQPLSVTFLFCSRDAALLLFVRFSFSSSNAFTSTSPRFFFSWEAAWAMIGSKKRCSTTHYTRMPHLKSQRSSGAEIDKTRISEEKIGVEKERGGKGRKMPSLKRRMEKSRVSFTNVYISCVSFL